MGLNGDLALFDALEGDGLTSAVPVGVGDSSTLSSPTSMLGMIPPVPV